MPRESLDAPENLLKEASCQGGVGELQVKYRAAG